MADDPGPQMLARFYNQFTACANQAMQNYLAERDTENRACSLADSER